MAERDWERRYAAPALTADALREVVATHLDRTDIAAIEPMEGGKINAHAHIAFEEGDAVVVRVRLGDGDTLPKEAALLQHFADAMPLPRVLGAGTLDVEGTPRGYLLLSWVPGESLDELLPALDDRGGLRAGEAAGAALARVHKERRAALGFLDADLQVPDPMGDLVDVWRGSCEDRLAKARVAERLGTTRMRGIRHYLDAAAPRLIPLQGRFVLLHGDFKPVNIRAYSTGQLTGILDWEFAWAGPALADVGQMLRWPLPPAFEAGFIAGYRAAGGRLEGRWREQATALDLMNLLSFLDWDASRARVFEDVRTLLDATLAS